MIALPATADQIAAYPRAEGRFGGWWWLESNSGIVHLRWGHNVNWGGPEHRPTEGTRSQGAACGMTTTERASHDPNDFPGRLCLRCEPIASRREAFYLGEDKPA